MAERKVDSLISEGPQKLFESFHLPRSKGFVPKVGIGEVRHQTLDNNALERHELLNQGRSGFRRNAGPAHAGIHLHMHGNARGAFSPRIGQGARNPAV